MTIVPNWADTAAGREAREAGDRLAGAEAAFQAEADRALQAAERFAREKPEAHGEIQAVFERVADAFPKTRQAETALKKASDARAAGQAAQGPQLAFSDAQDFAATHPEDFAGIRLRYEAVEER